MSSTSHPSPSDHPGPRLVVDLAGIPPEGLEIQGELGAAVFDLEPGGPQPVTPLRYRLHLVADGDRLVASGELSADFSFTCVRCLEPFVDRITLDGYQVEEEAAGKSQSVDLTDRVREDILLALPGHPRCEEASLEPRPCPASKMFPKVDDYASEHPEETSTPADSREVWGALDKLKLPTAPNAPETSRRNR